MQRGPAVSRRMRISEIELHYVEWIGNDPVVVLLHPNRTNARVWDFAVAHSELPNRFVALDHRGHGRSDWPERGYALEDYVGDDVEAIEGLADGQPVVLVGAATGGNVALLLASERPDLVRGLVVVDPGLSLDPDINADVQQQIRSQYRFASMREAADALPFSDLWTDRMRAHFVSHTYRPDADGGVVATYHMAAVMETEAALEHDLWERIDVTCPLLAMRGGLSEVFDRERMLRLASIVDDCLIAEVPRADHRVMQDAPAAVAGLLDAFVRGLD